MKAPLFALAALGVITLSACSTAPEPAPEQAEMLSSDLLGTWDVSLLFDPNAPPSSTVMEIIAVNEDGSLEGSFYASPFETARYRQIEGAIAISVITSDGSGPYATSGRLAPDGNFEGQTLSTGRNFLMTWSAEKAD